ncbi:MAG TPA: ABC transporter [Clostridiales bacterium]|jgi:energy-coupling factor transport system ATP-binding protein|uniref:energy-coupling factor ABC transporter ATP-binding protein n=1 Tax=Muricomes intestini TaxID=1796634 RepID=UPI000E80E15C|nr:ABC transporter [Clostridiales bacterium]
MKVEIKDLSYVYPSQDCALRGVSLVMEGTTPVAIVGQNGAGKTTLVKHLNGLLRPTSGQVLIDGVDINTHTTAQWSRKVGYVFQNPDDQLFLESVRKEFEFGPKHMGMRKEEIGERVEYVSNLVGLADQLDTHPFDLTSTQKRFCTIGIIMMMNPDLILFDEPTCGQDAQGIRRLRKIIQELRNQGKLCITISHDMRFVAENFKRIIVMKKGEAILDDDIEKVFARTETLKQCFITPPPITRVAQGADLKKTPFTGKAFMEAFEEERERRICQM